MTWLLQPLDTHVFAELKRLLRRLVMNLRIHSENGTITWSQGLKAATDAVHAKLVAKSWRQVMRRSGMDHEGLHLRPALANVLGDVDLRPRPPTQEEMETVLGTHGKHAAQVWDLLVAQTDSRSVSSASGSGLVRPEATARHSAPLANSTRADIPGASASATATTQNPSSIASSTRRVPIGRRLWTPQPRNMMLQRTLPVRDGPSAGTRSQKRPCVPGVVQTDSQTRKSRGNPSLSSVL